MVMEGLRSSETLVLTRATRSNIPEDTILYLNTASPLNKAALYSIRHYIRIYGGLNVQIRAFLTSRHPKEVSVQLYLQGPRGQDKLERRLELRHFGRPVVVPGYTIRAETLH
jgi:hypothetical protein